MKKYIIVYNDLAEAICQTRVDAEEYVLSCVEEDLYEEMLIDVLDDWSWSESAQAFIQSYAEHFDRVRNHLTYNDIRTINGFMLYCKGVNYFIYEVEELD